jgi:hypothetical protein
VKEIMDVDVILGHATSAALTSFDRFAPPRQAPAVAAKGPIAGGKPHISESLLANPTHDDFRVETGGHGPFAVKLRVDPTEVAGNLAVEGPSMHQPGTDIQIVNQIFVQVGANAVIGSKLQAA